MERDLEAQAGAGTAGGRVGEAQGAAVELRHPARDGQAEPGAAPGRRRCRSAGTRARGRRAATPGPWSATSSHQWSSPTPAVTRTGTSAGTVAPGVVEGVDQQLAQPGRVGGDDRGRARSRRRTTPSGPRASPRGRSRRPARPGRPRGARAGSRPPRAGTAPAGRRPGPAAARPGPARSARCSGSAGTTPSARFSRTAVMAASGVRSSWETVAMRSRRSASTCSRSAAIWLNAAASRPTSSVAVVRTRPE